MREGDSGREGERMREGRSKGRQGLAGPIRMTRYLQAGRQNDESRVQPCQTVSRTVPRSAKRGCRGATGRRGGVGGV